MKKLLLKYPEVYTNILPDAKEIISESKLNSLNNIPQVRVQTEQYKYSKSREFIPEETKAGNSPVLELEPAYSTPTSLKIINQKSQSISPLSMLTSPKVKIFCSFLKISRNFPSHLWTHQESQTT